MATIHVTPTPTKLFVTGAKISWLQNTSNQVVFAHFSNTPPDVSIDSTDEFHQLRPTDTDSMMGLVLKTDLYLWSAHSDVFLPLTV